MDKPFSSVAQGFRKRTLVTAKLSAKMGVGVAKNVIKQKAQGVFGGTVGDTGGDDSAIDSEKKDKITKDAIAVALALYQDMDQLKGLVMKFGQMASYMSTQFPPEAQKIIAKLQSDASALPFYEIKTLLTKALGKPVEQVFDTFEAEAIAAASIGQVHKASYQGQAVAVKIQYPGVRDGIASDLSLISKALPMSTMASSLLGVAMDSKSLYQELHDRILEECDYSREAKNQQFAKTCWPNDSSIVIPGIVEDVSSVNVLVSEFMEGQDFYTFRDNASQDEKNKAAETLYRMSFESIFKYAFFNGDPHPGNYLFRSAGEVVFLDFGCVRYFEPELVQSWRGLVRSVRDQDRDQFKRFTREMGFVGNEKKFNWDSHWALYNFILEPVLENKPFTFSKEYKEKGNQLFLYENKNQFSINLPPPLLLVNRLQWGLKTILVDLQATGDFHRVFWEAIDG